MPHDAPAAKVAATKGYGGNVVIYDRYTEDRENRTGAGRETRIDADPAIRPSARDCGRYRHKELIEEVGQLDVLFVCLGGGGLLSGSSLAARHLSPDCIIYGVEPEAGTMVNNRFAAERLFISIRRKPLLTVLRPNISGILRFRLSSEMCTIF